MPSAAQLTLPAIFGLFTLSAVAVWLAGARLTYVADELADRRRLSRSLVGLLLLHYPYAPDFPVYRIWPLD